MSTITFTKTDKSVIYQKDSLPKVRIIVGTPAVITYDESGRIAINCMAHSLISFIATDDITIDGTPVGGGTSADEICETISQLFPNPGGSGSTTESDTLDTVADRGNTTDQDLEITDSAKGVILTRENGTRLRITVHPDFETLVVTTLP